MILWWWKNVQDWEMFVVEGLVVRVYIRTEINREHSVKCRYTLKTSSCQIRTRRNGL